MYVIGQVESGHNWASVNLSDPITLGMMQWYGGRAYGLLARGMTADPGGWANFKNDTPTLASHVEQNDINWTGYFVSATDVQAWQNWAQRSENHVFQQAQWEDDYNNYVTVCDNLGIPSQNIQVRILFMTAYHQSPVSAYRVIGSVGVVADLDRLHSGLLADSVLGLYVNRYNTAYDLLKNWDGQSAPPDFGQVQPDDPTPGGNTEPPTQPVAAQGLRIQQFGDSLKVSLGEQSYTAYKGAAQSWQGKDSGAKPITSGNTGAGTPAGNPHEDAAAVLAWISDRAGKFDYSQGAGRLNPDETGYTDCSGLIWCAYFFAIGVIVGTWTGEEKDLGTEVTNSSKSSIEDALSKVQAGDILLIMWLSWKPDYDHEEIFQADTTKVWSHGGPSKGPETFDAAGQMGACYYWSIRRHLGVL